MNQLRNIIKKQARNAGMALLVFILLIGALLTPFVALNEFINHPISITADLFFGDEMHIDLANNVNARVVRYKTEIEKWTPKSKNGYADVTEFENVILAIMMTESGGKGNDPMQSSESGKNTKYPHKPNSIEDPSYSIECGVKNFADGIAIAKEKGLSGSDMLYAAIDGYNKGLAVIGDHGKTGHYSFEVSCQYCYEHKYNDQKKSYTSASSLKKQFMLQSNQYWDGGNWRWNYGNMFYVYKVLSYLNISEDIKDDGTLGTQIALKAQSRLGCRYWWGKEGPDYFDCSGLVYWCYKEAGLNIDRRDANSYAQIGKEIDYDHLIPGDIVTFDWDGDSKAEHIGIYIGNGYMIHAHGDSYVHGNYAKYVVEKKNISSGCYHDHIFRCSRFY